MNRNPNWLNCIGNCTSAHSRSSLHSYAPRTFWAQNSSTSNAKNRPGKRDTRSKRPDKAASVAPSLLELLVLCCNAPCSPTQNANMLISTIRHSLIYQWETKAASRTACICEMITSSSRWICNRLFRHDIWRGHQLRIKEYGNSCTGIHTDFFPCNLSSSGSLLNPIYFGCSYGSGPHFSLICISLCFPSECSQGISLTHFPKPSMICFKISRLAVQLLAMAT